MNMKGRIISKQILKQKYSPFLPESAGEETPPVIGKNAPNLDRKHSLTFPSSRSSLIEVNNQGIIYTLWTENILFKRYNIKGKYLGSFSYPYKKSKLDKKKMRSFYGDNPNVMRVINKIHFSDTWPAVHYFFIDDKDRLWVAVITNSNTTYDWWILSSNGKLIAKFKWPGHKLQRGFEHKPIFTVKNGYMYSYKENSKGLGRVVKWKIHFKPN